MWRFKVQILAVMVGMIAPVVGQNHPAILPTIPTLTLQKVDVVGEPLEDSGFYGSAVCDTDGNIYLRTDAFLTVDKNPVWKISPSGKKVTVFAAPTQSEKDFRLGDFAVGGDGSFYAVSYDYKDETEKYLLLRYGSDGEVSSRTRLQLPDHFLLDKIGVFASGNILVFGHLSDKAPEGLRNQPRVMLLLNDGTAAGDVRLSGKAAGKVEELLPRGSISMGDDGNAYLLRGEEVLVLSASGKLQRTIPVSSPATGFDPERLQISHGVLSVTFYKVGSGKDGKVKAGKIEVMFRTFDAFTGVVRAEYLPKAGLSNYQLCFNPDEGYTFLGQKDSKTVLMRAWVQ